MDREQWVAAGTVGTVAVVALLAAAFETMEPSPVAGTGPTSVVQAPPLATSVLLQAPDTRTMGAAACSHCGVVENVIAVQGNIKGKTQAVGFLMNIRMDDGTTRTVENRGALPAGSRVIVDGDSVRSRPLSS